MRLLLSIFVIISIYGCENTQKSSYQQTNTKTEQTSSNNNEVSTPPQVPII